MVSALLARLAYLRWFAEPEKERGAPLKPYGIQQIVQQIVASAVALDAST